MLCRVQSYVCVTCKLIYSLLIVNIFRTKNICQNDRNKTMRFNYKQCCNVFPFLALSQSELRNVFMININQYKRFFTKVKYLQKRFNQGHLGKIQIQGIGAANRTHDRKMTSLYIWHYKPVRGPGFFSTSPN